LPPPLREDTYQVRRAVLLVAAVVAVVLLATGVGLAQPTSSGPSFVTEWGSYGRGDGQFRQPSGVASDASGNIYVADRNNHRIQKFDSEGNFVTMWGSYGRGDGQFYYPEGLATDSSRNVYVVDTYNNRIQKFDSEGNLKTKSMFRVVDIGPTVGREALVHFVSREPRTAPLREEERGLSSPLGSMIL
jgi:DNA-binding beta-propeller fold protein YncE